MIADEHEPTILRGEALARIRASLPPDATFSSPVLEMAALLYLDGQASVDNGTGRGLKADLRAMHREVLRAANAITQPRIEILAILGLCGGDRAVPRFTELKKELAWLEDTLDRIIKRPMGRHSKSHPWYLLAAISLLASTFERAIGKRATNSLHHDGQYIGEPL